MAADPAKKEVKFEEETLIKQFLEDETEDRAEDLNGKI